MRRPLRRDLRDLSACAALLLGACAQRSALHRVVADYDETIGRSEAEMLLLNIARAKAGRPMHFTTVTGIAATFDYETSGSFGAELAENPGIGLFLPSVGLTVSENPTINIVPIQGQEFTERLLTPLDESVLGFFVHQSVDPVLLLELIGQAVILERPGGGRDVIENRGLGRAEFRAFLDRVAVIRDRGELDIGPLLFDQSFVVRADGPPTASELTGLLDAGYELEVEEPADGAAPSGRGRLSRRVVGRSLVSDYDPATRSDEDRAALHERAQRYPSYFVAVDFEDRGEGATRGWIKLRSLTGILDSISDAVVDYGRGDDQPTSPPAEGPLLVRRSPEAVDDALFAIEYEGAYYWIPRDSTSTDATAFGVLYRLYQMTVARIEGAAVPPVTITK